MGKAGKFVSLFHFENLSDAEIFTSDVLTILFLLDYARYVKAE
jgi:hypothetical protein